MTVPHPSNSLAGRRDRLALRDSLSSAFEISVAHIIEETDTVASDVEVSAQALSVLAGRDRGRHSQRAKAEVDAFLERLKSA